MTIKPILFSAFIIYATFVVILAVFLMIHTAPRYGNKNVLVYITICSSLGSFTVMGCKGVGVGLKQTMRGHNQFTNWMFYVLLAVVIACILIQVIQIWIDLLLTSFSDWWLFIHSWNVLIDDWLFLNYQKCLCNNKIVKILIMKGTFLFQNFGMPQNDQGCS